MPSKDSINQRQEPFAPLQVSRVALLTTFRRNGQGVATPVGIRLAAGKAYFTTWSTTGKVKRLAHNPQVTLAPCNRMGKVLGSSIEGIARLREDTTGIPQSVLTKTFWSRFWNLIYTLRGWQSLLYEVSPIVEH